MDVVSNFQCISFNFWRQNASTCIYPLNDNNLSTPTTTCRWRRKSRLLSLAVDLWLHKHHSAVWAPNAMVAVLSGRMTSTMTKWNNAWVISHLSMTSWFFLDQFRFFFQKKGFGAFAKDPVLDSQKQANNSDQFCFFLWKARKASFMQTHFYIYVLTRDSFVFIKKDHQFHDSPAFICELQDHDERKKLQIGPNFRGRYHVDWI